MVYSPEDLEKLTEEEEKVVRDVVEYINGELFQRSRFDKGSFDGKLPNAYNFSNIPDYGFSILNEDFLKNRVIRGKVGKVYSEAGWHVDIIRPKGSDMGYIVCLKRKKELTDQVLDNSILGS